MLGAPARFVAAISVLGFLSACAMPPPSPRGSYGSNRRAPISDDELEEEAALLRGRSEAHFAEQTRRVERVGRRLLETIPSHPQVQFVLVKGDPSVNAGATFGQVAITSGMLNFIESDDEMAVVLGHELAHITEGHVMKGTMSGLALNVLAIVLESRVPGAGRAAGGVGQLFLNRFSQSQEREADDVGLRYAYEAGYDPSVAAGIQERLAVETPQSMNAGYFDTHPSSVERAVTARRHAEELLAQGAPPGRQEVLALERAESGRTVRRKNVSADPDDLPEGRARGRGARDEPPARSSRSGASAEGGEDCRRAEIYREMARDKRDPAERQELLDRAARYCPSVAGSRRVSGGDRETRRPRADDVDTPLDSY